MPDANGRLDRIEAALERITQRDEAIAERQEALAQTVEIIAGMQRANERRFDALDRQIGETMVAIGRLLHIAQIH